MKSSIELKAMTRNRMAPKLSQLVAAVVIYGAILVGLSVVIAVIYTQNLMMEGVFQSEEAMMDYIMNGGNTPTSVYDTIISYGFEILIGALLATLTAGIMFISLKCARGEEFKATDIFAVYKMNPDRIIIIYLVGFIIKFIFNVPAIILEHFVPAGDTLSIGSALVFLLDVLGIVAQVVVTVFLSQAYFIYIDDPEQNSILTIRQSFMYMKKHFFSYLYLMLSFIPWYITVALSCGVLAIWVVPYINVTYALFYMNLKGELGGKIDVTV